MPYKIDTAGVVLLSAGEYLDLHKTAGRPVQVRPLGLTFYGLSDCLYFGDNAQAILPAQGTELRYIFRESCHYSSSEHALPAVLARGLAAWPEPEEVEEAVPLYAPGSRNLWHWMAEGLPKLLALESIGYTGKYIVADAPVVRQTLALLGIDPVRILDGKGGYRIRRMLLPQRLSGFDLVEYMPLVSLTREKLLAATGRLDGTRRLYVRRIGRRKPANEEEVLALLDEFGFSVMVPEEHSLAEQLRAMTHAECSVMAHGANSALCLMQPPRSGMVEFFSNRYVSYNNLHAARLLRLRYHPLVEDLDVSSAPSETMTLAEFLWSGFEADMFVDIRHLRVILESLLDQGPGGWEKDRTV